MFRAYESGMSQEIFFFTALLVAPLMIYNKKFVIQHTHTQKEEAKTQKG